MRVHLELQRGQRRPELVRRDGNEIVPQANSLRLGLLGLLLSVDCGSRGKTIVPLATPMGPPIARIMGPGGEPDDQVG